MLKYTPPIRYTNDEVDTSSEEYQSYLEALRTSTDGATLHELAKAAHIGVVVVRKPTEQEQRHDDLELSALKLAADLEYLNRRHEYLKMVVS